MCVCVVVVVVVVVLLLLSLHKVHSITATEDDD